MTPKEKDKDRRLQRTYGITLADYKRMLEEQKYRCPICGKHNDDEKYGLVVDHLHAPHRTVRGLTCRYCNRYVIGKCSDYYRMKGLVKYITKQLKGDKKWKEWCDAKLAKKKSYRS